MKEITVSHSKPKNAGRKKEEQLRRYPRSIALLDRIREKKSKVDLLRQRVSLLRLLTTDTSAHLREAPGSDSPDQQRIATLLSEIDGMEREIAAAEREVRLARLDAGVAISRICEPRAQKVLQLYYLEDKSWGSIAEEMSYSKTAVFSFREIGMTELENLLRQAA